MHKDPREVCKHLLRCACCTLKFMPIASAMVQRNVLLPAAAGCHSATQLHACIVLTSTSINH